MPGPAERRKMCRSPHLLPCHTRKSSVQPRKRHKRSELRDSKLRAESAGDLPSRKKSFRKSVHTSSAAEHESKVSSQEKSSAASSRGCTLFPMDVTDCLKNVCDWEAMEIRILDKDKCTVLRSNMSDTQRSDKVIVHPSLYQTDHTVKGSTRSNQNTSRGSSVLKQTVCVEKVHVRNLLHTKREKCGNLGSSRSSEYMPSETTTLAGTLTNEMNNLNYFRISGSNIGLFSSKEHSAACSGHSPDTSDIDTGSAHILHTRCETGASRAIKQSSPVPSGQSGQLPGDDSSSNDSEECTTNKDDDSDNETSGSGEDEYDDDDNEIDEEEEEEEEGQESDEASVESSISDDSYYKKYYKEKVNNTKLKQKIEIQAEGKQMVSESEDATFTSPFLSHKYSLENKTAVSNTQCTIADLNSSRLNWQKSVSKQTPSHTIDSSEDNKHKTYAKDWSVTPNENQKTHCHIPYFNDSEPFCMQQGEPVLNLNEPSTSLSISEDNKWDTAPHSQDCFSSTQSVSTLTSTAARKASFIPMPEEEIARYKQIALQILTERKQRALEDSQSTNVQPTAPHNVVEVQPQQTTKKKRNRPSRKYHKSTRLKSKDAKTSEACQNTSCRSSQRAGFWASWRIKNQIEKHRKRFHSADVNTSKGSRSRNTHALSTVRCPQKSPKLMAYKDRNSDIEHTTHCPGFLPFKVGSITQKPTSQPLGRIQSKRLSCPMLETLKAKHESTVTGTKVSNAPFKVQKPPTKTHSSLLGTDNLTVKKSAASIPVTMRSTQSHYYLKPSANTYTGTKKAANMGIHPLPGGQLRTHYEHGTKAHQVSGKTYTKRLIRACIPGQGKSCTVFANEKQIGFNCESTPMEGKMRVISQAGDTPAQKATSKVESFSKTVTKAEGPNQCKFNVNNFPTTNQNLPRKVSLTSLAIRHNEGTNTPNLPATAAHEQEATPDEGTADSFKPRAYLDLVQNILKSPTAKAAQALGTFLQKPEAHATSDQACDITVDQIINSYQKLFDQLYDLSSKTTVNDKPKINENVAQLESSHTLTETKTPKDTNPQHATITAGKKVPATSQTHLKSVVIANVNALNNSDELECDKNVSLNECNERETLPRATGGFDRNKFSWKSKENTRSILHATEQATAKLFKSNTIQTEARSRATGSVGVFRLQGRPYVSHDYRHVWRRSATPDKRSATENRFTFKQIENRKSKSSHDSSETANTYKQCSHTQRKPAFEVRSSRTPTLGILENNYQQSRVWSRTCRNTTSETPNKTTSAKAVRKISFSDSTCCGIKPKVNTFLKTSFSCTRQPTAASRMNQDQSHVHKCRIMSQLKDMPDKIPSDDNRACMEQTETKATHVGLINAAGTSLQCMATIQSNPECSSRLTNKFLVHKECTSSIKAHSLVTSAQASAGMITADRAKLAGEGQPFIKDMSIVVRDADTDSEKRELSAQSLHTDGQYHQVHERSNSNRTVKCSTESVGMVKAYPAITIFAPQACLNILTPKPPASPGTPTATVNEAVSDLRLVNNISPPSLQLCLPVTADSELSNDKSIEPLGSNEDTIYDDKSAEERKDSMAMKLTNAATQRRPIRPVMKSNSEQWAGRDENCCRRIPRDTPNGVAPDGQKQVHFKGKNAFRYGLSVSSSVLTQGPSQREQNTSVLMRPPKKCACITPCDPVSYDHTNSLPQTTDEKRGVRNCFSHPSPCVVATVDMSGTDTTKCTLSADAEATSFLPCEPSLGETDEKINMKPYKKNSNGAQHTPIKNISAKKTKTTEVCPSEGLGNVKSKTARPDRKASLSWSRQHLTRSQEVKDKHFVTSTALRAIFVTPFSPFHRVDDHHIGDAEGSRRPLAWQQRRCRSAEGFEVKNATSRVFTYGKKKLPPESFSSSAVRKSLKSNAQLRASASNCALCPDTARGQGTCSGAAKHVELKIEGFTDTKPTGEISKLQHGGDAFNVVHNSTNTPVKSHGSTKNASPGKKDPKIYDRWNTPPWKPTVSEDESELSDGSSLQAVRKHIVANTCRMIIRESRNLIVSNLQRHTREDSPEKSTPPDNGCHHKSTEGQPHITCVQTAANQVINNEVLGDGHNYQKPETLESKHTTKQPVLSSKSATEGSDYKLTAADQHDSSTKMPGEPTNSKPDKCSSMPTEGARLLKPEIPLHNPSAPDAEYGEGKELGCDIQDMTMPSKLAEPGKQCQTTHTGAISPTSEQFPDKDMLHGSEKIKRIPNNTTGIPVVENKLTSKQMQYAERLMKNVALDVRDTTHHSQSIDPDFQQDANKGRDANTLLSADQDIINQEQKTKGDVQDIRNQEQKTKGDVQENTNTDRCGLSEEESNENSYQELVKRREPALSFTQQETREFGPKNGNTHNVNLSKKNESIDNREEMNNKEHESEEVWQNDHNTWQKGRNIQSQQKGAFQNPGDTIQAAKDDEKENKDKEYSFRQKDQGNKETVQQNIKADKGSRDVKHQKRKVELEDNGKDQRFKVLERASSSTMQETRDRAIQSPGSENGDPWQRSRNVDETSSHILQRCTHTDKIIGGKQQDNLREKEEKNKTTNEKTIEPCSREIVQRPTDKGHRMRDIHEDNKQNRNTENQGIDKWRKSRTIERGRIGTRQKSRSVERKTSDISQTNKSAERVSTDSSQHSLDRGVTEAGKKDRKVRLIKSPSRHIDDTGEDSTDTIGKQTSAERHREVGHQIRNGELTHGDRGVHISAIREQTRNKAQINHETQYNKRKHTWSKERGNRHDEKNEAQRAREKRYDQRMIQDNRNERHEQREADTEETDKRHEQSSISLREGSHKQNREEIGRKREERNRRLEESVIRPGERFTDHEDSDERYEQRDSEQDERDKEYASTDTQQQESENDSEETDGEFEERDKGCHRRDMKLTGKRAYEEYGNVVNTIETHVGTRKYNIEEGHESTDNMQDSRHSDGGSCLRQTRQQECNSAEKSPRARCQNLGKPAYETSPISGKYKQPSKGSREFGQELRGKVGVIGRTDQGKKDLRHRSRDTKLKPICTNRKSRSVGYESNDSDLEGGRGVLEDNRSPEIKVKHCMQRVLNQQHRNSNREQEMAGSGQDRAGKFYITRTIKQAGRDAIDEREHTGHHTSHQNTSESEDEAYLLATRKGRTELAGKSGMYSRKPAKIMGPSKMSNHPRHKMSSVANTTQTEESCLIKFTSPWKCVQTRDQHTETEDILAPQANQVGRKNIGETEHSVQENNIYTRLEQQQQQQQQQHSSAETFIFPTDKITGVRDSPEELQPFKVPSRNSAESSIPQKYVSELDEMQTKSPHESLRRRQQHGQALVNDGGSLLHNLSEMHATMPLLPVTESTRVLVKTLSLTDSLASIRGSKRPNLGKRSKSNEAVVVSHKKTISYLYDGAYHSTRSSHKRQWNTNREIVIGSEVNSLSPTTTQRLPESSCHLHALQRFPQSAMGHWRSNISADSIAGRVNKPVIKITCADTCRRKLLPMLQKSVVNTCLDLSPWVVGSCHNSSVGKKHSQFLLNVKTGDAMKSPTHHHQMNETHDDTIKVHTRHQKANETNDTLKAHKSHKQKNKPRDDAMTAQLQHRTGTNCDAMETCPLQRNETNNDTAEAHTHRQQRNEAKEVGVQTLEDVDQETVAASQQPHNVGDSSRTQWKHHQVAMCESSIHVKPVSLWVDTVADIASDDSRVGVRDTGTADARVGVRDTGTADARVRDTGSADARVGVRDTGTADARVGLEDIVLAEARVGVRDTGSADARVGVINTVSADARVGVRDTGPADARVGVRDTGSADARVGVMDTTPADAREGVRDTASADARVGVRDTTSADARVGVKDTTICESTSIDPEVLQTEHRERFSPHRTISRETSHVVTSTVSETSRNNSKDSKDEVLIGPAYSTSSTGHSLIVKSAQSRILQDTQNTIQVVTTICSIASDNCGFFSNNVQHGLHSEIPYISVNNFSTGDLQIDTSIATGSQCYLMDEPKPEIENLFHTRLLADGITTSQGTPQGGHKSNEKLSEEPQGSIFPHRPKDEKTTRTEQHDSPQRKHTNGISARNSREVIVPLCRCNEEPCGDFQHLGSLSRDLTKITEATQTEQTEATQTEQTDYLQRIDIDKVSASSSQETIVPRNTFHINEGDAQAGRPALGGGDSGTSSCSCYHFSSKSHMAMPRVCLHVPRDGCVVQGDRTRQTATHVSFQDECHSTSTSNYDDTTVMISGSGKQEENETRQSKLEKNAIDLDIQERCMVQENKTKREYCEVKTDHVNAIEANPEGDTPCQHCACVATQQSAFVVSSARRSDDVGVANANKAKTVNQKYVDVTRDQWHQDTVAVRTREGALNKEEYEIPHSLKDVKPGQSDHCLKYSFIGRNEDMTRVIEFEGNEPSGDATGMWKKAQHNTSKSVQTEAALDSSAVVNNVADSPTCNELDQVRAQLIAKRSPKPKLWQESSTQTLLKQSDFDDSLRLNQSIFVDKTGYITLLRDSCIGTSDVCTESDARPAGAATSTHDDTATPDESVSGVPQAASTAGCVKTLCSPLSSLSSKTEGVIRRVLSRSPDVKISHIQQKAMENLELFVKSTRESHVSGSEPRTSPPCKPSSQSPSSDDRETFLKDFVIQTPLHNTPSMKLKSSLMDADTSLRDTKMHTDCSESIPTYSKPSTDNVQMYDTTNKQTSLRTDTKTVHKQIPNTQLWMDSNSLPGSTSHSCLLANQLHVPDRSEPCSMLPANTHINTGNDLYQAVTQETSQDNHSVVQIPCWPNAKCSIYSSQNGQSRQNIMEHTRNPKLASTSNEISKETLVTSPGDTYNFCMKEREPCIVCPTEGEPQVLTNVRHTHSDSTGPAVFHQASVMATTLSNNTEKSQSACFTRSCTNPFLQSNTNPFIPSAPLFTVPYFELEQPWLDIPRQPAPSLSIRPNPFLDSSDAGKTVEDWGRSRSSRNDSFLKDNTHNKLSPWDIEELMSPLAAVTENTFEGRHHDSKSRSLSKGCSRYLKMDDDLIFFSDASRDTDDRKPESESKLNDDKGAVRKPDYPLIVLSYQEDEVSKTRDEHWTKMPNKDGDEALQVTKTRSNEVYESKASNKQEARKRRQINMKSSNNVGFSKATGSFHKKPVCLEDKPGEVSIIVNNSNELESGNKTSTDSLNNSISDNLTSHCLLLQKISGLQRPSASNIVYSSSEESPDDAVVDASSSFHSLNSHISEDPSDDIREGRRSAFSPSRAQTQINDETANLNILETVTTLTSKFIDIFNGLKKNIHKSAGRRSRKRKAPNLERQQHYYHRPISKSTYPRRRSRNETTRSYYASHNKLGSRHLYKYGHKFPPKIHSQFHNQNAYKLHKHTGKRKPSAMKKSFNVKSSNTATSTQSDDHASSSNSSEQRMHCHRDKEPRSKMNDEFSISPHVYTEYRRLPVYTSHSESSKVRAVSSHTTCHMVNEISSHVNQTTSDSKNDVFATVEKTSAQAESVQDHIVSDQGTVQAPQTQCHDNYHSYPEYAPPVFLPRYSQFYVSVHNGGCYLMPNIPFMSTVFTIVDDNYGVYLPEQQNTAPKLVLVDDDVGHEDAEGGGGQADVSAAAMTQPTRKQTTPLLLATNKPVSGFQQESDSPDTVTGHTMRVAQKASQDRIRSAPELGNDNGNLCENIQPQNDHFARYVDVVPLLRNAEVVSKDTRTQQLDNCDVLGEIMHLAEGLDSSWKEANLYEPYGKHVNEKKTDRYDAVFNVKCTNHGQISSSNLEYDLARFSASGFLSLHGQYYINEDLSSPPKRKKCEHSNRTKCPAGASISKWAPETGQRDSRDYYHMDIGQGCNKKVRTMDLRIPSMTFESRLKGYRKDTTPYFCYENARTPTFLSKIKDSPITDGGASITYSYKGYKDHFSHILGCASPLSDSLADCSEKRESSTEMEVKAKTKDEKQYHYDDCEPDTYDELGSLCSEMQDTTSKLYQGEAEYATCKDPTGSYDSKSISLGPTFAALLGEELAESPHSISNAATQTIQQAKRCTPYSHYFGTTLECSKKEAAKSRFVTGNKICQLPTDHANQFPVEQRYLLPMGQDYQLSAESLEDSCYKNVAPPLWNIGLISLRSAPVTRSCFTQTDRGALGQESIRPNLVQIRDLMGRCIKSRHFRYYVQNIVDERVRNTLRQKAFYNNDGNRTEKTRVISLQKRNKKRVNEAGANGNGNTSARHTLMQASLPGLTCQENVINQEERVIVTAKSCLVRKSSSNGSICVKQGSKESHKEGGTMIFRWSDGVDHYVTYPETNHSKSNSEHLADDRQPGNTIPEEPSDFLQNPKQQLSFNSKDASNDNATNGAVTGSFPIAQNASEEGLDDKNAKLWNSAVPTQEVQKHHFCLSPPPRINNGSTAHLAGVNPLGEHSRVSNPEKNTKTQVPIVLGTATCANICGIMTAEAEQIVENTNLQGQKATASQPDVVTVSADFTNNTQLEESTVTDCNNTIHIVALHNESVFYGRSLCEMDPSSRTAVGSPDYACPGTRGGGAQEMSDVSSSSSTKIDYGRLKNIMSAETKLLWRNLTRLEKSYDRCKRCRKQYESILGSNKISGECEAKTEKLDTACELHSEDLNITRCSNQSTEMIDDCPQEKCTCKNVEDVMTYTEQSQENVVTCITDQYTHQVFNEVNTFPAQETNNTSRAEQTMAVNASPIKDSACEDRFDVTKVVQDDTYKKPWHVKGKNTAKMIQIFERGNGFFQDNEQESSSNHKKRECSNNEQRNEQTYSGQQTHTYLRNTETKSAGNAFQMYTKKLKRSTAFDEGTKINCLERVIASEHGSNKTDKARETSSNTQSPSDVKLSSDTCDVANQQALPSATKLTDAQHILAMNAPNSETDEWIQKLVNILHEMQQAFPQIAGTSGNSVIIKEHVDQKQETTDWSEQHAHSPRHGVSERVEETEMHEANLDTVNKSKLKMQRKTPTNTPSLDHPADPFDPAHSHVASMACSPSQINSKDTKTGLDKRVFHSKKIEHHLQGKDNKSPDPGRTEAINDTSTQKMTPETTKTDRGWKLERIQQRHTPFSWHLKSADVAPRLMPNTNTYSELASPNKCMDENNQASGSLPPSDLLSCEKVHIYDMIVADDDKKQKTFHHTFGEPCYITKHNLNRLSRLSCRDSGSHKPVLEKEMSISCERQDNSNATSFVKSTDSIRKVHSCITITKSYNSPDWAKNNGRLYPNPLKMSDSESQVQTFFEGLYPHQDVLCMTESQLGTSPGVTNTTQDVFMISSRYTSPKTDDRAAPQFNWPRSARREVFGCPSNTALQATRNSTFDVRSAKRDIISKHEAMLLSVTRSPDCNINDSSVDTSTSMASDLSKTDILRASSDVDHCFTQQDDENLVTDLTQGSQRTPDCISEISDESEIYQQKTPSIQRNLSSQTHTSNIFKSVSAETKQSKGDQALKHTSGLSSVLSEEGPGFGESYQLTMATMNDVKDTSLISNDDYFIDDIDTSVVTGNNTQPDSVAPSAVKTNIDHCGNVNPLNTPPVYHESEACSKKTPLCSYPEICVCPAENTADNKSYFPWKESRFRRDDALDTSTYAIITKRLRGSSKRHKSVSPPSVSLKEYISNDSETASKDISFCLPSSNITSGKLDSRTHQTNQLQSFDIPIDIYTVPVYRSTSPQKRGRKKADLPTKTVVISGPVRNMSIAVQRHTRSYDQDGFANRSISRHISPPHMTEGSSPTDTANADQIGLNGYDRKSVPNWRDAMKRMLPFGKRTPSNEKKIQSHLVT